VMPDHVHLLLQPSPKRFDANNDPVFWSIAELMQSIKSFAAHEINKIQRTTGPVWEKESFDRLMRSESDLAEKFHYILRNPWDARVAKQNEDYPWIWTADDEFRLALGSTPVSSVGEGVPPSQASRPKSSSSRDATTHTFATANPFRLRTNPSCVRTFGGRDAYAPPIQNQLYSRDLSRRSLGEGESAVYFNRIHANKIHLHVSSERPGT
jgi:hypothetical protein